MSLAGSLFSVIGSPVGHSLSPVIHAAAFEARGIDGVFGRADVSVAECESALNGAVATGHRGLSVTMPLKEQMARCTDALSPLATHLGAVNCVVVDDARSLGHNTDGDGCCDAIERAGARLEGRRLALFGAGGTARSIAAAAAARGAAVVVINRTRSRAEDLADMARRWCAGAEVAVGVPEDAAECDMVVNATSVGFGSASASPVDPALLGAGQFVLDAVYSPLETTLLAEAARAGATVVDGLWMLVHQAVRQQRLWFESSPIAAGDHDIAAVMRAAAERELARRPR